MISQLFCVSRFPVGSSARRRADEPTGNLDTQKSREIMELLARLNTEQGITILLVTHEQEMARYAKRVVHFVDGLVDSDHRNGGVR